MRVVGVEEEGEGIRSIVLEPVGADPLPAQEPGAHLAVHLPGGMTRQYSLCGAPGEGGAYRIAVLLAADGRGGSAAMHALCHGDLVEVSGPFNHFPLGGEPGPLLVAGGIGITPILAMAEALAERGEAFSLDYCVRSAVQIAFADRLQALGSAVAIHADDWPAAQAFDIAALLDAATPDRPIYVCGPAGFIGMVQDAALTRGWPRENIRFEYFAAPADPAPAGADDAFLVQIGPGGPVIGVPAGTSIVAALAAHGIDIPVSCEQGICGSCLTPVLAGEPDHRDHYLTAGQRAENRLILPCCSRACSQLLVLDL